jgi:hypothetical protein
MESFRWTPNRKETHMRAGPALLFSNFPTKLTCRHVKEGSEQHTESECLPQQPEEEDHWIQS